MTTKQYQDTYTITGKAMWAKLHSPDDNGKNTLDVKVEEGSEEMALLERFKIPVKTSKDGSYKFFSPWRYANNQDGEPNKPLRVVDAKLTPITDLVGNDSLVKVEFFPKDWTYTKGRNSKSGTYARLVGVQVLDLVRYERKNSFGKFQEEDGFTAATETNRFSAQG